MTPVLIDGPAVEPVTLEAMRAYLRVDCELEDPILYGLIRAARLMVEASARRLMIIQTWRLTLDAWPACDEIRMPFAPLQSVVAARVFTDETTSVAIPLAALAVDHRSEPGRIARIAPVATIGRRFGGLEIDVIAGYGPAPEDVPQALRQAVLALAAHWFEQRGDTQAKAAQAMLPEPVRLMIQPFRQARLV